MVAASYCAGRGVVVIDVNASGIGGGGSVAVLPSVHLVFLSAEVLINVKGLTRLLLLLLMMLLLNGLILTR